MIQLQPRLRICGALPPLPIRLPGVTRIRLVDDNSVLNPAWRKVRLKKQSHTAKDKFLFVLNHHNHYPYTEELIPRPYTFFFYSHIYVWFPKMSCSPSMSSTKIRIFGQLCHSLKVKLREKVLRSRLIFVLVVLHQSTLNSRDKLSVCKAVAVLCFRSPQANQFPPSLPICTPCLVFYPHLSAVHFSIFFESSEFRRIK